MYQHSPTTPALNNPPTFILSSPRDISHPEFPSLPPRLPSPPGFLSSHWLSFLGRRLNTHQQPQWQELCPPPHFLAHQIPPTLPTHIFAPKFPNLSPLALFPFLHLNVCAVETAACIANASLSRPASRPTHGEPQSGCCRVPSSGSRLSR